MDRSTSYVGYQQVIICVEPGHVSNFSLVEEKESMCTPHATQNTKHQNSTRLYIYITTIAANSLSFSVLMRN